jgi:phenylacetic acid degradation operon negative regulatory protein
MFLWLLALELVEGTASEAVEVARSFTRPERWRRQLAALQSAGFISTQGEGRVDERMIRLTDVGRSKVWGEVDPEALWRRPWDGLWRTALFDVPQSRAMVRARMRRRFRHLRFGWLQNSVWLSPDPIVDLLRALREEKISVESLVFMEGRPAGGEIDAELVIGAWDFDRLARMHADYLKLLRAKPKVGRGDKGGQLATWLVAEDRAWRAVARADPFLPEILLPAGYAGRIVWQARSETLREVLEKTLAN